MGFEFAWSPSNVMEFNEIQRRCAREIADCTYIDVFHDFLDRRKRYPLQSLYHDCIHPSAKGSSILARAFIRVTRSINFDMRL